VEGFGVIAQGQGAKAVLASLWPVADQSTAVLMADLYKRMTTSKMTKAEALRQAEIGLRKDPRYSHPYYWAPFVLMGNWQ
jgi:CHAT domain-containing protein